MTSDSLNSCCITRGFVWVLISLLSYQVFPDNAAGREIASLPARCLNQSCNWTGSIKQYEVKYHTHIGACRVCPCLAVDNTALVFDLYKPWCTVSHTPHSRFQLSLCVVCDVEEEVKLNTLESPCISSSANKNKLSGKYQGRTWVFIQLSLI